jgi:hypothetical protein
MAGWHDVSRVALALPESSERLRRDTRQLWVRERMFVWERPLRRKEVEELGDQAPDGPILGARVEHELAKRVLIGDDPRVFFTTSHFKGYPAVLVRLDRISAGDLEEIVTEAWLVRAPKRVVEAYLGQSR